MPYKSGTIALYENDTLMIRKGFHEHYYLLSLFVDGENKLESNDLDNFIGYVKDGKFIKGYGNVYTLK
ncbi:hypothetical protein [Solitalea canadensis]|uniref:Uncharacterized protein n=1 Tax=Solitalea canadensis (strain ATCC 29591 / DSM 3403 / JCM 21819 / LMG 8368 / NBRC 15130 / NCIMB 12057 / USAM 9D) TaxID=929556 RepID=H8KPP5_SOLCM|nr:hypothetical protein [Solitalea canadensis]AFD05943.1 hypothetical protein Solca_0827 [Solitalea canadensis DSM 3403]